MHSTCKNVNLSNKSKLKHFMSLLWLISENFIISDGWQNGNCFSKKKKY